MAPFPKWVYDLAIELETANRQMIPDVSRYSQYIPEGLRSVVRGIVDYHELLQGVPGPAVLPDDQLTSPISPVMPLHLSPAADTPGDTTATHMIPANGASS